MGGYENLKGFLSDNKEEITQKWYSMFLQRYPAETVRFMKREKDQFANPVGHNIREGIQGIYNCIIQDKENDEILPYIDKIIKINAVQDLTPAQAVSFMFILKEVVRNQIKDKLDSSASYDELLHFESRIDEIACLSFGIYMDCREKLNEIKVNEIRNRTYRLLERANLVVGEN